MLGLAGSVDVAWYKSEVTWEGTVSVLHYGDRTYKAFTLNSSAAVYQVGATGYLVVELQTASGNKLYFSKTSKQDATIPTTAMGLLAEIHMLRMTDWFLMPANPAGITLPTLEFGAECLSTHTFAPGVQFHQSLICWLNEFGAGAEATTSVASSPDAALSPESLRPAEVPLPPEGVLYFWVAPPDSDAPVFAGLFRPEKCGVRAS